MKFIQGSYYTFIVIFPTFLSLAVNSPTLSALSVSQTLQLKSSYPAMRSLPEKDGAREVTPHMMLESWYVMSSWSPRRSNSLREASSEPVITALPLGKNCGVTRERYDYDKITMKCCCLCFETVVWFRFGCVLAESKPRSAKTRFVVLRRGRGTPK